MGVVYGKKMWSSNQNGKKDLLEIVSNHSEQSTATTYEPNSEETTEYEEENFEASLETFEAFTSKYTVLNIQDII